MESLKLWALYLIPEDSDVYFLVETSYWEVRIDELGARNKLADRAHGVNNTYVKVLQDYEGNSYSEVVL